MVDFPFGCTSKMAGRLPMIVTIVYGKIGRAQLKAILAQTNAPIAQIT